MLVLGLVASCSHAPPQVNQVFSQVNHVYDPVTGEWSDRLSVFVLAASTDGSKVFDRLHVIHDGEELYTTVNRGPRTIVERKGEFWLGTNDLTFPDGRVPLGTWRAVLVTKAGQKVEAAFEIPPQPPGAPKPRSGPVTLSPDPKTPLRFSVSGWVDDYLVWARDAQGSVLTDVPTFGPAFSVPTGTVSVVLYSYDKKRGEGLEAGPFPVQNLR